MAAPAGSHRERRAARTAVVVVDGLLDRHSGVDGIGGARGFMGCATLDASNLCHA